MLILIRGAGDIATGIALRLHRAGMQVVMTDLPHPTAIRRTVCFSPAIALGAAEVEGVRAVCARDVPHARVLLAAGDTFRAAAAEQLSVWAERAQVEIVKH